MADYVEKSNVQELEAAGFSPDEVRRAMARCNDDVNAALDMLTSGRVPEEDHFDLLARSEKPYKTGAEKGAFAPAANDVNKGAFRDGLGADAAPSLLLDGRLSRFAEMGFDAESAERALAACGNDVDAALSMLLGATAGGRPRAYSDSPHDVLAESADPYGKSNKAGDAFSPAPSDPNKGNFRETAADHASDADAGALLDGRLARFREMGFAVNDAERALASTSNDVDAALTKLLNARDAGFHTHASPHDVLAEAADPYASAARPKKRPDAVPNDPDKGKWLSDAPPGAGPAAIVDARLAKFSEMGFDVADAEKALELNKNDVDAALSSLLQAKADSLSA